MNKRLGKRHLLAAAFGVFLVAFLAVLPAAAFGHTPPAWAPVPLQDYAFDVELALAPSAKKVESILAGSLRDEQVYVDSYGERVAFQNEGLEVVGTLYRPLGSGLSPGVILLHGSTPEGRKLGLYRVLGHELASRGYTVLSLDQRGYGESADPPDLEKVEAYDTTDDIQAGVDYLSTVPGVDPNRLYIIGHSGGADPAIIAGIEDSRLLKIVAIGPPRRVEERLGTEGSSEFAYFQRRAMRYMRLSQPIPAQVFQAISQTNNIEKYRDYFASPGHKPLLLVDGSLESEQDQAYLEAYYESISQPKAYVTLAGADHYANIANFGPVVIMDERAVEELVDALDSWLSGK